MTYSALQHQIDALLGVARPQRFVAAWRPTSPTDVLTFRSMVGPPTTRIRWVELEAGVFASQVLCVPEEVGHLAWDDPANALYYQWEHEVDAGWHHDVQWCAERGYRADIRIAAYAVPDSSLFAPAVSE